MLELWGKEQIKTLGSTLIDGAFHRTELDGIPQRHLERDLSMKDHEGGRSVVDEMKFRYALLGESGQLRLVFLVQTLGVHPRWWRINSLGRRHSQIGAGCSGIRGGCNRRRNRRQRMV